MNNAKNAMHTELRPNQEYDCPSNTVKAAQGSVPGFKDMNASRATRLS